METLITTKDVFEAECAKLTDAQKEAVETIEGPVMCIAGPGTGKTQVVALRVANILKRTQMRPTNILCLTYSTSGATAMRERLRALIGPDAYGVKVDTIHGFCNEIIGTHPHVFEEWSALEQVSDVERYRMINGIIDDLMPDCSLVSRKFPYQRTRDIIGRISQIKREGVLLSDLERAADQYDVQMGEKSKEGTKAHEKDRASAKKFREFMKVFQRYQDALNTTQRYDYEDMILHVIAALREEDWLLASLQERYQYILVDEFQDTNGAQDKVIRLLTTYANVDQEPNLFIVGDDDQAIYRFQGANVQNILSFHERFPKAPIIVLAESFRCTQQILDAAGSLIAKNTERLVGKIPGLKKDVTSASGKKGIAPRLLRCPSDAVEPFVIADLLETRLQAGIEPEEIAVLTQTNAEVLLYYDVFKAKGLPVDVRGKADLLNHPLVKQVISILYAIEDPSDTSALAAAISCECFGCGSADIARLFSLRRKEQLNFLDLLLALDDPASPASSLPLVAAGKIIAARDTLLSLSQQLPNRTLVSTLEHVLQECGFLPSPSTRTEDSVSLTQGELPAIDPVDFAALQAFFDRVKMRSYEQPEFSLPSLLADLKFYRNPDYGDLRVTYELPHITEHGIQLMTAHKSKGLEFRVVILPHFRCEHWDKRRHPSSLSIPEDLLFGWQKEQKSFEQLEDERRLAYVAMTRAKEEVIFTCPKTLTNGDKAKDVSPSAFFAEAGALAEEDASVPSATTILLSPAPRNLDAELRAYLKERLESFSLSVTALNHFLEDPQMFLESDLLETPQAKEASLVYGNAVHSALKMWGMSVQEGHPLSQEQFLEYFTTYLQEREVLTDKERARLLSIGLESLPRYFTMRLSRNLPIVHKVEYPMTARLGDIPLKGLIDRIDLPHPDSGSAFVVDFKTGKPKSENEIRKGDYFRQLTFYGLLFKHGSTLLQPTRFTLDFVGEGSEAPIERVIEVMEADQRGLEEVIKAAWEKIISLDFTPLK